MPKFIKRFMDKKKQISILKKILSTLLLTLIIATSNVLQEYSFDCAFLMIK